MSRKNSKSPAVEQAGAAAFEIIRPASKDLGGFSVRRLLPAPGRRMVGPWIFFDHMGPAEFSPGEGVNVRPHPHINLATVTYLFEGEILHRDSLGSCQAIRPGDINLMIAGRGIVHSEREHPKRKLDNRRLNGLQLWLALPDEFEEVEPAFLHYPATDIPSAMVDGVAVRVIMGQAFGCASPVKTFADTIYLEADLSASQKLTVPAAQELAIYIAAGEIQSDDVKLGPFQMQVFIDRKAVTIKAMVDSRIVVIGGQSIGHRHIDWNFVSSRKSRIEQARDDWREGRFPKVPGDGDEYIPLPE